MKFNEIVRLYLFSGFARYQERNKDTAAYPEKNCIIPGGSSGRNEQNEQSSIFSSSDELFVKLSL